MSRSGKTNKDKRSMRKTEPVEAGSNVLIGRNPVKEALKGETSIDKILIQDGARGAAGEIISMAREKKIRVDFVEKETLDRLTSKASHQGVVALIAEYEYKDLDEILRDAGTDSVLIVLDGIEDPHNLGAIMRTAECTGADGVVIPKRRGVGITDTVAKTSAGAVEYMPCARVTNISQALDKLKDAGYWVYGLDMDGDSMWRTGLTGRVAFVIGNEGRGVSRLVREKCDVIISIPMQGKIDSLNASNAAAVVMYEAMRQRMERHE